jgi:surface carbohydrate biosynthesis protein
MIIPRHRSQAYLRSEEEAYFSNILYSKVEFVDFESAYDAVDSTSLSVTIDSTLGYESIARGNKTSVFSVRGTLLGIDDQRFGLPGSLSDVGPFWINIPEIEHF